MSIQSLRASISEKYAEHCSKIHQEPNKSVIRELLKPSHVAPPSEDFQGAYGGDSLDLIFRGNDKLNFTSRLRDRDAIILCEIL